MVRFILYSQPKFRNYCTIVHLYYEGTFICQAKLTATDVAHSGKQSGSESTANEFFKGAVFGIGRYGRIHKDYQAHELVCK